MWNIACCEMSFEVPTFMLFISPSIFKTNFILNTNIFLIDSLNFMLAGAPCTEHTTTTTTAASPVVYVNHCLRQLPSHLRPPPVTQTKTSGFNRSSPVQWLFKLPCVAVRGVTTPIPWQHLIPESFPAEILCVLHLLQNHSIIKKKGLMQVYSIIATCKLFHYQPHVFFKPRSLRSWCFQLSQL